MSLNLEDKKAIVAEISGVASKAISAAAAEYRGLSVTDITKLRVEARKANVYLKVVRNTLARRAVKGTSFECMDEALVGPLVLAFSDAEPSAPARLFRDFAKTNDKLAIKVLSLSGRLVDVKNIETIASLPTRDEAIASLMSVMLAPISKFVRTMAEPHAKLVRTVAAIRDQKEAA